MSSRTSVAKRSAWRIAAITGVARPVAAGEDEPDRRSLVAVDVGGPLVRGLGRDLGDPRRLRGVRDAELAGEMRSGQRQDHVLPVARARSPASRAPPAPACGAAPSPRSPRRRSPGCPGEVQDGRPAAAGGIAVEVGVRIPLRHRLLAAGMTRCCRWTEVLWDVDHGLGEPAEDLPHAASEPPGCQDTTCRSGSRPSGEDVGAARSGSRAPHRLAEALEAAASRSGSSESVLASTIAWSRRSDPRSSRSRS